MSATILSYLALGSLLTLIVGAVYSTIWYAIRRTYWPGVETAKLPSKARAAQAIAEILTNLPSALWTLAGRPGLPPGTPAPERPTQAPPPPSSGQSGRSTVAALLVVALAAVVTLLLALGLAVSGCDPTQHDPTLPPVRVYVSADWPARDRPDIAEALARLAAVGPSFAETEDATGADVILRPWESRDCATDGAGQHLVGTRLAQVDRACAPGAGAFRAFVGHEVLHALGLLHVCTVHESGSDCSPTVRGSPAMMARSPFVDSGDPVIGLVAVDTPQALDLAEYSRARGR